MSGQRFDQTLGRVQFKVCDLPRNFAKIRMGERMIADLVPFGDDPFYKLGICLAVLADDEECGFDVFLFENIEYLGRPDRIGAVVECQRDLAWFVAGTLDNI